MQHSHNLIDMLTVNGQSGVFAPGDEVLNLPDVVIQVDADDLVVRHHDVIDRDLFQVEDAQQHLPVPFRYTTAGLVNESA